jgi:hypothetical protein
MKSISLDKFPCYRNFISFRKNKQQLQHTGNTSFVANIEPLKFYNPYNSLVEQNFDIKL